MAQITITAEATVTIDGATLSQSASYIADVRAVNRQTKDVTTTYAQITDAPFQFALIENVGDVPILLRMESAGGEYFFAGVAPGCHIFTPSRQGNDNSTNGGIIRGDNMAMRTTSGNGRVVVTIGTNLSN